MTTETHVASAPTGTAGADPKRLRGMIAGTLGNTLEWYDFGAYGFLAAIFAKNFFPADDAFLGLLAAFGMFAASFFMRPLGGILFGDIGDRFGRRRALYLSAMLMTVSTVGIGLLPTYAMAGALAPVMLLLMRLLQGISVGGEQIMSVVYLAEGAPPARRGLIASLATFGANTGTLLGSAVGAVVAATLTAEQLVDWGWRLPFLAGILLGGVALVLRSGLGPEAAGAKRQDPPLVEALRERGREIALGVAMTVAVGALFYLIFIYLTTYMQQVDGMPARLAFEVNTASMLVLVVACCGFAALGDRLGRKPVMLAGLVGLVLFTWPLFHMLGSGAPAAVLTAQVGFAVLISAYAGPMPAALVELFHRDTRCTAYSLAWNFGVGWVGGLTPMVAVYLIHRFASPMAPALLIIALSAVSLLAVLRLRDRTGGPI
ncbi:MFS transporter [Azorhizobium sp. AG788]|uniref:MFS transporter n=1 Tax=Azorhizobium sp. AG788 TaxID=2183897 RepID=UPI00313A428F